jgi:hypothetical protein
MALLGMTSTHTPTSAEMRACIEACLHCHTTCLTTVAHCLDMAGEHASRAHQTLLADCAQACITSAGFLSRQSQYHERYCEVCAEICEDCAADCYRLAQADSTMLQCAEACQQCAMHCRNMSQTA